MGWPLVKIKECCTVFGGATPKRDAPEYWGNDFPWITPKDISNLEQPVLEDAPEYISKAGYDSAATYMLPKGAILLTSRAPIGNVAIAGREMCTNQGFKSLVPGEDVDSKYLYYCMKRMAPKLESIGNGATFKEVSKTIVEDFEIPLPQLKEQKRIAAILDKADAIRRKRQQAIQLADEFLRSVFLDMFGDPAINPMAWSKCHLGELVILGPDNGIFKKNSEYGNGMPVVWVEQLYKGDVLNIAGSRRLEPTEKELEKYGLNNGDIVFCRSSLKREGIGFNNIYDGADGGALFECHMTRIRLNQNQVNPYFVNFLLKMKNMRRHVIAQSKTVTMTTIDQDGISRIEIIVPPKDKQDKFSEIFRNVITQKHIHIRFNDEANHAFSSLNQRAFQGGL